jgi:PHD/YefM family antitoxin component YafN of YafNO toxin-antitoxin module
MTKSITLKKLRPGLPRIIDAIDLRLDRFIITRRGKPVAMMMAIDDYEGLLETLDILANRKLMKKIERAKADIKKGRVKALSDLEREMGIV